MVEIVKLKNVAESRAGTLEKGANQLREGVKSLKKLLGSSHEV
jgi:hypothetical protein